MAIKILLDQLLTQLNANEEAINLIIDFISSNNDNEKIKLALLEQIKQNLDEIKITDDNRDFKNMLEVSAIDETIKEFNNHLKAEQTFNQLKETKTTEKNLIFYSTTDGIIKKNLRQNTARPAYTV